MSVDNSGDRVLMISMKTTVFTLILSLIAFAFVFFNFYPKENKSFELKTEKEVDVFLVESTEQNEQRYYDDDPDDYDVGFQAGKFALYSQLNLEYQPEEEEVFAYSSFVEENNDPKYFENPEYDKGYVDGYHRATEQVYCPASLGHK